MKIFIAMLSYFHPKTLISGGSVMECDISNKFSLNNFSFWRKSFTAKLIMIGLVVLLCQIPVLMVDGLISRRQGLAQNVEKEIATKWGYRQKVSGPLLAIPLSRTYKRTEKDGKKI